MTSREVFHFGKGINDVLDNDKRPLKRFENKRIHQNHMGGTRVEERKLSPDSMPKIYSKGTFISSRVEKKILLECIRNPPVKKMKL